MFEASLSSDHRGFMRYRSLLLFFYYYRTVIQLHTSIWSGNLAIVFLMISVESLFFLSTFIFLTDEIMFDQKNTI